MSIILEYQDKSIEEEQEGKLSKKIRNHLVKEWNWENFFQEDGKTIDIDKFNKFMLKKRNQLFDWKSSQKNAGMIYLYFLIEFRSIMPLYVVTNSIYFMKEDEVLAYYQIIKRDFKALITDKVFLDTPKVKTYSIHEILEFRKFPKAAKYLGMMEREFIKLQEDLKRAS